MLSIFFTVLICIAMSSTAAMSKRRGWLWALLTLLWITALQTIFGGGATMAVIGGICSFITMFIANTINDPNMKKRS